MSKMKGVSKGDFFKYIIIYSWDRRRACHFFIPEEEDFCRRVREGLRIEKGVRREEPG